MKDMEVADANKGPTAKAQPLSHAEKKAPDFSTVKGIYFDLDDTLCTYWDASKHGLRRAFELHGPEGFTVDEMIRHWATCFREFSPNLKETGWYEGYLRSGEPTRVEQMRLTLQRAGIKDDDLANRLAQCYCDERDSALRLFEDSEEVLTELKKRFPLGLITNGPADVQRQEIATTGVEPFFDVILIEGEMGRGKPHEEVFRMAEAKMGLQGEEILFVGNSYRHDILPAIHVGWKTAWVRRPSDVPPSAGPDPSWPEEIPPGSPEPDVILSELRELLDLLA